MRNFIAFLFTLLLTGVLSAQTIPNGLAYEAVAHTQSGETVDFQTLLVRISLYETESGGKARYIEFHEVKTDETGRLAVLIGNGMPEYKSLDQVEWEGRNIFIELAMDLTGDGTFDAIDSRKVFAVPFAFQTLGSASEQVEKPRGSDNQRSSAGDYYWSLGGNKDINPQFEYIGTGDTSPLVIRTDDVERMRVHPEGNITMENDLNVVGNVDAATFTGDGSGLTNLPGDGDADPTNELQTLSQVNTLVTLSDGGGTVNVADDDNDPTNELQTISLVGNNLTLSDGGGSVTLPSGGGGGDPTDELQDLSLSGDTLSLSNDPTPDPIDLGPYLDNTDNQLLSLSGFELSISGGNTVTIPNTGGGGGLWSSNSPDIYFSGGNVGIGTSTPDASFEIHSNSTLSDPHILLHEDDNDYARLNFDNINGSNYWTIAGYNAVNPRNDRFNIWNGATGDILSITGDGRMGLNAGISPKATFHIGDGHRVLFGSDTLGSGDKLMFLPDLHAFRVGTVAAGAASTYWNRDSIGLYSFASGLNTRAQGFGATATGRDTEATNSYAFASGYFSNADGQYSTAMGFNTDALALGSTALGYSTDAEENYSFAAGYFAEAQAIYSVAIGNGVQAQSYSSMAIGRYNEGGGSATTWNSSDPVFEIGIGTSNNSRANAVTVRKDGNVGIGTSNPLAALQVNGQVRFQTVEYFEDGGTNEIASRGDIRPTSDNVYDLGTSSLRWDDVFATSGTVNTSDLRDKTNVQELPYGLDEILRLEPVIYEWKNHPQGAPKLGLIAQDVLEVLPEVVKTHNYEEGETPGESKIVELERMGIYYDDIIPVLIRSIQEQHSLLEQQVELIEQLTDKVERLQKRLEMIEEY